jgi:hypothetical protein
MPEQIPQTFEEAFKRVQQLAADFKANERRYLSSNYQEAEVRKDFVDKFWMALGWDVNHDFQTNPYEQEVKVERGVSMAAGQRRADYAFYLKPNFRDVRFFVEAKKPSVELATKEVYFQVIRYGWSSNTPLAVVHDFEQFHVLDCRYKPDVETALHRAIATYHYSDYAKPEKFRQIYWLFSREAVAGGSLEKRAAELPKPSGKAVQRGLFPGAYKPVDESFLEELDEQRTDLARAFKSKNPRLDSETLTELAQRTLDRLVFLRFLEDKGIEAQRLVDTFGDKGSVWEDFVAASRRLDGIYNSIVFKEHAILDAPRFRVDEDVFANICERLASVNTPYDFNFIPIHILGSIYERFLGKVIVATDKRVRVEEKPEVRKAGGVYYTPEYIVRYIVENTVGTLIAGKKPEQIAEMRFADIACGSGSFLLGVFDLLLQHHGTYYNSLASAERARAVKRGDCIERDGDLYLSLRKKREILVNNIYGVDIDAQAVEVCQLSLYLKLLKDETTVSAHQYLMDFEHVAQMKKLLPDLSKNIVCGNSLIGRDISEGQLFASDEERKLNPMNFEDAFPHIFERQPGMVRETEAAYEVARSINREGGRRVYPSPPNETHGFDVIVGNPPYGASFSDSATEYLVRRFPEARKFPDSYCLFILKALSLIHSGGYVSMIVPNTFCDLENCDELRRWLLQQILIQKIWQSGWAFRDAVVDTLVFQARRQKPAPQDVLLIKVGERSYQRPLAGFLANELCKIDYRNTQEDRELLKKATERGVSLSLLSTVKAGVKMYEKGKGTPPQSARDMKERPFSTTGKCPKGWKPLYRGEDVTRFQLIAPKEYVNYGPWLAAPRSPELFLSPKILMRRTDDRLLACIEEQSAICVNSCHVIKLNEDALSRVSYLYLLGLLNSRLMQRVFEIQNPQMVGKVFAEIKVIYVERLPICTLDLSDAADKTKHDTVVRLVEQMVAAKAALTIAKMDKDRTFYENKCAALDRQIDTLVYELYGLTADEIAVVEGAKA